MTSPPVRLTQLDGLRAVAILLVLLFHFVPTIGVPVLFQQFCLIGWTGVDLFFVLSGFLITSILVKETGAPGYYKRFILRRSFRIFPLYYASILLIAVLASGWNVPWGDFLWKQHAWWFLVYLGNIHVVMINAWPSILAFTPLWSLQVEEQFYLSYPLLVRYARGASLTRWLVALSIIAPLFRVFLTLTYPDLLVGPYVLTPSRMDALALGGLVAVAAKRPAIWTSFWMRALTLISFAAFLVIWWNAQGAPWPPLMRTLGYSLIDFACAGLLASLLEPDSWLARPLRFPALVFIGQISYGMYLLHLPAAEIARKWVEPLWGIRAQTAGDTVLCIIATVLLAWLASVLIEQPLLRLRDRWVPRR